MRIAIRAAFDAQDYLPVDSTLQKILILIAMIIQASVRVGGERLERKVKKPGQKRCYPQINCRHTRNLIFGVLFLINTTDNTVKCWVRERFSLHDGQLG